MSAAAGLELDPWQQFVLRTALGEDLQGLWTAFSVGLIVPRQNGKGSILEALELYTLFLRPDARLIMHSAHEYKALDVSTPMLTTAGWSTMGELVDGDEVFAPDGQPTKVLAAHPVRYGRPCFRLSFDDGQTVVADAEHLWEVVEGGIRKVLSTQAIFESGVSRVKRQSGRRDGRVYRFRVDVPTPLTGAPAQLPVHPWLLGAWLGDGTSAKGDLTVGAQDLPYVCERLDGLGETYRVRPDHRWPDRVSTVLVQGLANRLRAAAVLNDKRIPAAYLLASVSDRRELLAGLLDTDGGVHGHQVMIGMSKRVLMDDVASLVRSLGYKASMREYRASLDGVDAGPFWRVQFTSSQAVNPFGMPRKAALMRPAQPRVTRSSYNAIVAVDPVDSRPTRCITVAHESSLYLAGRGFIPTHNTAAEHFLRIRHLIESTPMLHREVAPNGYRTAHGEQGIELLNGSRIRFVARSTGSGRGFTGDLVVLDEAYELDSRQMTALLPTMSSRPNPQLWYASSAGLRDSVQLHRLRQRGIAGDSDALAYMEWSAEDTDDPADPHAWAKANPALGIRISEKYVRREMDELDEVGFARERLGIWEDIVSGGALDIAAWNALADGDVNLTAGAAYLAVDIPPDRSEAVIAVASAAPHGRVQLEVLDILKGTSLVVEKVLGYLTAPDAVGIVIDSVGPAASLLPAFKAAGVEPLTTSTREYAQACGAFFDGVSNGIYQHLGSPALDGAVRAARTRPLGDSWAWARKTGGASISPLVAATLAAFGLALPREQLANPPQFFSWSDMEEMVRSDDAASSGIGDAGS